MRFSILIRGSKAMRVVILREGLAMEAFVSFTLKLYLFIISSGIYNEVVEKNLGRCGDMDLI